LKGFVVGIRFVFALHNHQPVGNFDGVFEGAYRDSYAPFLELLEGYGMSEDFSYSHLSQPGRTRLGYVGNAQPGVERRIYTSGVNKAMLDPFLPENPEHVARLKAIQEDIHATFIDLVKSRRADKLSRSEPALFSGEYWAAKQGIEHGLVDRIGDLRSFLRERYGDKVETPLVSAGRGLFGRTTPGVGADIGDLLDRPGLTDELISSLEARAIWARYGL